MSTTVDVVGLEQEWLTQEQVGQWLQLSAKSVGRLAKDPTFPVTKLGAGKNAAVRIHRAALVRWLAARTQGTRKQVLSTAKPASAGISTDA